MTLNVYAPHLVETLADQYNLDYSQYGEFYNITNINDTVIAKGYIYTNCTVVDF